jgi:predicted DNA binding CopG/RHH family protein
VSQSKKLSIKPGAIAPKVDQAEAWVNRDITEDTVPGTFDTHIKPEEKMKRITFELPENQHQAIKIRATQKGMTIKEYMIALLGKELGEDL